MSAEKLIEYVRDFPLLYNLHEKDYSDVEKKELAWNEIGSLMNCSASDCKRQWYNLRDSYRRAMKKRKHATPGQASKNIKRWKFEDEMEFLLPYLKERETNTSMNIDLSDKSDNTEKVSPSSPVEKDDSDSNPPSPTPTDSQTFANTILTEKAPDSRKKLRRQTASAIMMQYILGNKKNQRETFNDVDHIFQGLATTIKRFSPYNQALAKAKVVSLVSELEIRDLQEKLNESYQSHPEGRTLGMSSMMAKNKEVSKLKAYEPEKKLFNCKGGEKDET